MERQLDGEVEFILRNFDLRRNETVEIEGLRSLFRYAAKTAPFTNVFPTFFSDTLRQAQHRMNLIQVHENRFFGGTTPARREAMIVAAILDEHAVDAGKNANNPYYKNLEPLAPYIRDHIGDLGLNVTMLMEAPDIMGTTLVPTESFCLHVAALSKMRNLTEVFSHLTPGQRRDAADSAGYLMTQFAKGNSDLSAHARKEIAMMQERLRASETPARQVEIVAFPGFKR